MHRGAVLYLLNLIERGKIEALEKENWQDFRYFKKIESEIQSKAGMVLLGVRG